MELSDVFKNIDIIRVFKEDPFSVISTSDIEGRLNLSHHPTFRRLKMLEENSVLLKAKGGYSLNMQSEMVLEIMRFLTSVERIESEGKTKQAKDGPARTVR